MTVVMRMVGSHVSLGAPSGQLKMVACACRMYMSILRRAVMRWQTFDRRIGGAETLLNCRNCNANLNAGEPCQLPGRNRRRTLASGAQEHHNRGSSLWPMVHAESRSYGPISCPASNARRVNKRIRIVVIVLLILDVSRSRHAAT